jgi:hypothetical protein
MKKTFKVSPSFIEPRDTFYRGACNLPGMHRKSRAVSATSGKPQSSVFDCRNNAGLYLKS